MTPKRESLLQSVLKGAQGLLLVGNLGWTLLCLGGYRADTQLTTFSLAALLALVHAGWRLASREPFAGSDLLPAGFLVYGLASQVWVNPAPWLGWAEWSGWLAAFTVYWVVRDALGSRAWRRGLFLFLVGMSVIAAAMAFYQRLAVPGWLMLGRTQAGQFLGRSSGFFGIPNSLAALMLLVLPATVACAFEPGAGPKRRIWFLYLALVQAAALYVSVSRGAWMALGAVLIASPLVGGRAVWRVRIVRMATRLGLVAVATAALLWISPEARDRASRLITERGERTRPILWGAAWRMFETHTAMGGGFGTFDLRFERFRPESFQDDPQWAHNEYLNTLADEGALGFVLLYGGMVGVAAGGLGRKRRKVDPRPGSFRRALGLGLGAFLVQAFVDFHFKLPGLAMGFALVAGVWRGERKSGLVRRASGPALTVTMGLAGLWGVAFVWGALPNLRAEALRYPMRRDIDHISGREDVPALARIAVLREARQGFAAAVRVGPRDGQAWADRAFALELLARESPRESAALGVMAEAAARRALALSPMPYEFWLRLGVALDMRGHWGEAGEAFAESLRRAPNAAIPRYYLAYHFSQRETTRAFARSLVETCLRLDPSNRPAQDLQKQLDRP